ncbi:MAG: efflux RND transporter periplasmic adaptor subunit [Phycisphaerales bacterium]
MPAQQGTPRGRRRGRVLVLALIAGTVVGVGVLALYAVAGPARTRATNTASAADIGRASMQTFDITATSTGDLQAKNQIELRSELDSDSTILELVAEGTVVTKGDLVIKLNGDQLKTQIDEESLRVETAKAELVAAEKAFEIQTSENESNERQAKLKFDLAELALKQWQKGDVEQKNQDILLAKDKANRDLKRLRLKFEQNTRLLDEGFLSKDQYDQDEIRMIEADAALAKAELDEITYREYQFPKDEKSKLSDVEEAAAELHRTREQNGIQLTIKDAARLNQRRQLGIRDERLTKLQQQFAACTMLAPSAGLVVYASSAGRNWDDTPFQIGRQVRPRETLIVLPDTSEMVAVVKVHESLAGRVRPGQDATVKIDMLGGQTVRGRVESIGVMADTGDRWRDPNRREYSVRILLDKAGQENLRPSMRCEAVITLARVEETLAVPIQAVFSEDGLRYVYTPRGSKYDRIPVKINRRSDTFAEIAAGLEAGVRVLLRQPAPGEVLNTEWEPAALKLVGFELGTDGKPVPIGGAQAQNGQPAMMPTGGAGASPGGPNRPRGDRAQGQGGDRGAGAPNRGGAGERRGPGGPRGAGAQAQNEAGQKTAGATDTKTEAAADAKTEAASETKTAAGTDAKPATEGAETQAAAPTATGGGADGSTTENAEKTPAAGGPNPGGG